VLDASAAPRILVSGSPTFYKICFLSPGEGWLVEDDHILHTVDAGRTWSKREFAHVIVRSVRFLDSKHGWAVGQNKSGSKMGDESEFWQGVVYTTKDGGETWSQQLRNVRLEYNWSIFDVYPVDAEHIWVVGDLVFESKDGGSTWKQIEISDALTGIPAHIEFNGSSLGWITTTQGNTFLLTKNGGASWELRSGPVEVGGFYNVIMSDSNNVWGVANDVFYSADGGANWTKELTGHFTHLSLLSSSQLLFAAGNQISSRPIQR
jgi:photosystem II stability/assembly factor-like uncharacterized protein